jgi:hypothetical protein
MTDYLITQINNARAETICGIERLCMKAADELKPVDRAQLQTLLTVLNNEIIAICQKEAAERYAAENDAEPPTLAIFKDRHGHEVDRIILNDNDPMDCEHFAKIFADGLGIELHDESEGIIPDGMEDYSVTITDNPHGVRCWNSANYMIKE